MSAPTFQFYVKDWLISTRSLSAPARGVFIDMLALAWDNDGLPADPATLAAMVSVPTAMFKRIWPELQSKWPEAEAGKIRNPRQEILRGELMALREQRAAAGRASGEARRGNKR